jgi:hypothetical protein
MVEDEDERGSAAGCPDRCRPGRIGQAEVRLGNRIGWNVRRGWWARRRDGIGGDITAAGVDGLWNAIREDYAQKSVPRDAGLKASP